MNNPPNPPRGASEHLQNKEVPLGDSGVKNKKSYRKADGGIY